MLMNIRNKALVSIKEKEGIGLKKVVLFALWQPACIAIQHRFQIFKSTKKGGCKIQ